MVECVIAEDEELLRNALLQQLGQAWPELRVVAQCEDGASALEAIAECRPDVAFLDIRMPGTKNRKTGRYRQTNWSPLLCTARPDAD